MNFSRHVCDDQPAVLEQSKQKSQETVPLSKMWTDHCLGGAEFYHQAHIRHFANQLSNRDKMEKRVKTYQHFPEKFIFLFVGTKRRSKVGQKIRGQNVTDFGIHYYSESKCHILTNRANFLGWNVTILADRTVHPL